jgi:hypothetical protein
MLLAAGLLALGLLAGAVAAGTSTFAGLLVTGSAAGGTPVLPVETHTLTSPAGNILVAINHGNLLLANASATTPLSLPGPVPAAPFVAKTTPIFAGGQCGAAVPPPGLCAGFLTGGSGDKYSVFGSAGSLSWGPDAVKGAAGCPWGMHTCLWDNPTKDVSAVLAPGDTSAFVAVTSSDISDGADCINWVAQVLAVGPTAAWTAGAGYTAAGRGLRNQGTGAIVIAGVPLGSEVVRAYLYWEVRGTSIPSMTFNGVPGAGTVVGTSPSTCWTGSEPSVAFRRDVTPFVTGNGLYVLSGYPTGSILGNPPWVFPFSPAPRIDGASLIVFFKAARRVPQHFKAYELAQPERFTEAVTLVDQFGEHRVRVEEPEMLFTPVEKRRSGRPPTPIERPDEHLVCYGIDVTTFPERTAVVSNQFVERSTLTIGRPKWLCTPASKTLEGPPGPPPTDLDHYLCYDVRTESPRFSSETLGLTDQFHSETARIDRAREHCNPVEKRRDGRAPEPIKRPEEHLVCYRIVTTSPLFTARDVFTLDQFGPETLRVVAPRRLCVPSEKIEEVPPPAG